MQRVAKSALLLLPCLAGLAPALAHADIANATVYGTLNLSVEAVKARGATTGESYPHHLRLMDNNTNIGFKGAENIMGLAGNTRGIFQVELDVRPAAGTTNNLRNSMVGLQGDWGTFFFGKWDTPFRAAQGFTDPFYNAGVGAMAPLTAGIGGSSFERTSFDLRKDNIIQYWSPALAGFSAQLAYSPKQAAVSDSKYLAGGTLQYSDGPFTTNLSYERHQDYVTVGQADTGLKLCAGYKLKEATTANLVVSRFSNSHRLTGSTRKTAVLATVIHRLSDFALRGGIAKAGNASHEIAGELADTGATQLNLGASYSLSKRTELYALYARIANEANAYYNFISNAYVAPDVLTQTARGSDPTSLAMGVRHTF